MTGADEEFQTLFTYSPAIATEPGVARRDPSDVIEVGGTYYVWYTRVSYDEPTFPTGYGGTVWYATSPDGHAWTEQGEAVAKGGRGAWDEHGVFTPSILVADGGYYVFYTAVPSPFSNDFETATRTAIGAAVSGSPAGPWEKVAHNPLLSPDAFGAWDDFRVDDACFLTRDGKHWLYYKGVNHENKWKGLTPMGVAIAERPDGPYVRHDANPLVEPGHEVLVWPHREGVAALAKGSGVWYSQDGVHFTKQSDLGNLPQAPGAYRPTAFADRGEGCGITWGISQRSAQGTVFLERFDCELTP